jgi:hypothetical protein
MLAHGRLASSGYDSTITLWLSWAAREDSLAPAGVQAYWHRRFRRLGGRPKIDRKIRGLIRRMNRDSSLWGAPRIQDELLMLGHLSGAMAPRVFGVELQLRKRALDDKNPYPRLFAPRSHRTVDFQSRIQKGGKRTQAVALNERKKETTSSASPRAGHGIGR